MKIKAIYGAIALMGVMYKPFYRKRENRGITDKTEIIKTVKGNIIIDVTMNIKLFITKEEAKALHGIVGYGSDAFLEVFYPKLGKAYLQNHEEAMRSLFSKLFKELPIEISKIEQAEKLIGESVELFKKES